MLGAMPTPSSPALDEAGVERIVTIDDPLQRNAAITRGYHDLSEAVAGLLGRRHANWLTFGQWASAEARRSIDGEAVPAAIRPLVGDDVAAAVAAGNAAIFADVAPPFIRFVREMRPVTSPDPQIEAAFGRLAAHPQLAGSEDLTSAFRAYADALRLRLLGEEGSQAFANRVLVANASVGAHEQRVADPFVRAAIPGRWIAAIAATMHMGIRIPEGVLELSRDVPPPDYLGGAMFPPGLETLADPDALALAVRFGQDPDSAARSDAPDWESYDERMGFIFTLLRAHQCDPALFALPPGTPEALIGLATSGG
jgi:hypothetical protein